MKRARCRWRTRLAVSQAADSLVLLGDPRQLDQPQKASHPDGVGISALEHVLNGAETMPDRGLFLPATYRMSRDHALHVGVVLRGKPGGACLAAQALGGTGRFDGSGLWLLPVVHDGNQNASAEEVEAVLALVASLLGAWHRDIRFRCRKRYRRRICIENGCHGARPLLHRPARR